jgi:hypothetical protein
MKSKPIIYYSYDGGGSGSPVLNDLVPNNESAPVSQPAGITAEQLAEAVKAAAAAASEATIQGVMARNQADSYEEEDDIPDEAFESVADFKAFMLKREEALKAQIYEQVRSEMAPTIVSGTISSLKSGLGTAGSSHVDAILGKMTPVMQNQALSSPEFSQLLRDAARMKDIDSGSGVPGASNVAPGGMSVGRTADERQLIQQFASTYGVSIKDAEKKIFGGK